MPSTPENPFVTSNNSTEINLKIQKNLNGLNLSGQNLEGLDMSGISAFQTNFSHSNLSFANLENVDLISAKLVKANLSNANLDGVVLPETDNLEGANLNNAYLLGGNSLQKSITTERNIKIIETLGYYINKQGFITKSLPSISKLRRQN